MPASHKRRHTNYVRKNIVVGAACMPSSSSLVVVVMMVVTVVAMTIVNIIVVIHTVDDIIIVIHTVDDIIIVIIMEIIMSPATSSSLAPKNKGRESVHGYGRMCQRVRAHARACESPSFLIVSNGAYQRANAFHDPLPLPRSASPKSSVFVVVIVMVVTVRYEGFPIFAASLSVLGEKKDASSGSRIVVPRTT